jgi:hypothetical protein
MDPFYAEYPTHTRNRGVFKHLRSVSGPSSVLYLSRLPNPVTAEAIHSHMALFGDVVKVKTFVSGGRVQALVEYEDAPTAATALVLSHGSKLLGSNIWVAFSKNRPGSA